MWYNKQNNPNDDGVIAMSLSETELPKSDAGKAFTYLAFISYKSEDRDWALWLQRKLQSYRLPAAAMRKRRDLPKRCSPIFLDRTNLTPGLLDEGLRAEVQAAKYLIVVCSRHAKANSKYLDAELQYFLEGGGDASRVIPFIVDDCERPELNCFPDGLQALCAERTIVGVSVHDMGRRLALLKVVAAMLGIKREELESQDLQRRKRSRIAAAALALLLLAGGWKCWDYFCPKTAWYVDYAEVYGVPQGIGKLRKAETESMDGHFTIISSRGKVRELRYENAQGRLETSTRETSPTDLARAVYSYDDGADGALRSVDLYDKNDHLIMNMDYRSLNTIDLSMIKTGENGESSSYAAPLPYNSTALPDDPDETRVGRSQKSNVIRYCVSYDEHGYTTEIRYASNTYNDFGQDAEGISGLRFERDELGRVVKMYFLSFINPSGTDADKSSNFAVIGRRDGLAAMRFAYDENNDLVETRYLDAEGNPFLHPSYGCICRSEYEWHNEVRVLYLTADEEPYVNASGVAGWRYEYDAQGQEIRYAGFGKDGEPVICEDGYTGCDIVCDERGQAVRASYFGTDGERVLTSVGVNGWDNVYDENGNRVKVVYFDTEGNPILNKQGYAGWEASFDERGNRTGGHYIGLHGETVAISSGEASWVAGFDERGNQTSGSFFDADGNPTLYRNNYARWEAVYDKRGNSVKVSYFGLDGEPILHKNGYAGWETEYDERGNALRLTCFGTDGKPVLSSEGVAGWKSVYDERGHEISAEYFDADGRSTMSKDGYARWDMAYDEFGNKTRVSYYDTQGQSVLIDVGIAGYETVYDARGHAARVLYFGTDGEPILSNEGIAGWEASYDERGNRIRVGFLGMDGEPVLSVDGCASRETVYDERGNETCISYFGLDGEPVLIRGGFACEESVFDARGNELRFTYLGTDGAPILSDEGIAGTSRIAPSGRPL